MGEARADEPLPDLCRLPRPAAMPGITFGPRARMACGWDAGYYGCELELPLATGRRTP